MEKTTRRIHNTIVVKRKCVADVLKQKIPASVVDRVIQLATLVLENSGEHKRISCPNLTEPIQYFCRKAPKKAHFYANLKL